jgi:hypothetical protein
LIAELSISSITYDSITFTPQAVTTQICNESKYEYGYNGQLKVNEYAGVGNHVVFKNREQDTRTGRFLSVDPLSGIYPWNSPYDFAENSVIDGKDLEGLEHYYTADGSSLGKTGKSTQIRIVNNNQVKSAKTQLSQKNPDVKQLNSSSHAASHSTEGAAKQWGKTYNAQSIQKNQEMGSDIYQLKVEGKTYYNYAEPETGKGASTNTTPAPSSTKTVADIHSHAAYDPAYDNENFSLQDKIDNSNKGINGFVVTPNGSLKEYDPVTGQEKTISTDMPSDPHDPGSKKQGSGDGKNSSGNKNGSNKSGNSSNKNSGKSDCSSSNSGGGTGSNSSSSSSSSSSGNSSGDK